MGIFGGGGSGGQPLPPTPEANIPQANEKRLGEIEAAARRRRNTVADLRIAPGLPTTGLSVPRA